MIAYSMIKWLEDLVTRLQKGPIKYEEAMKLAEEAREWANDFRAEILVRKPQK